MDLDDITGIITSILLAVSTGGASQIFGMLTDPIVIATYQVSASFGWLGAILIIVLVVRLVIQDTEEYLAMGVYSIIAILMLFLPLETALILMVLSWIPLSYLGVKVGF
jgi:hypothetical protein